MSGDMEPLTVTITANVEAFETAMRRAIEATTQLTVFYQQWRLVGQRHRSRIVTRRKQRRSW